MKRNFTDDIYKYISLNDNTCIFIQISLKGVSYIYNSR